jgi:RimJ/RimL family protein N-acetyltransferase
MDDLEFREMTEEEFSKYLDPMIESYAQERARNLRVPVEREREAARKQVKELLPEGLKTKGHLLYNVVIKKTGEEVGELWVKLEEEAKHAFIYDISIREDMRGRGLGKQTLSLLDTKLAERKIEQVGLNVFADNLVAQSLYKSMGYYPVAFAMQKDLRG